MMKKIEQNDEKNLSDSREELERKRLEEVFIEVLKNSYLTKQETTKFRGFFNWEIEFTSSIFF